MSFSDALQLLGRQALFTPPLEWVAIVAAVAEVLLARANKVWLYPAGLISTCIYTYIFLQPGVKLYADALLNVYYFVMSVYGWMHWSSRNSKAVRVSFINSKELVQVVVFSVGGWAVLYGMLKWLFPVVFSGYTPSDVAGLDAFISATAWVGMWLLARRKVENWLLLNLSNLVAVPVLLYKGMPFTAALTIFLFIVAIFGYIQWRKDAKASS